MTAPEPNDRIEERVLIFAPVGKDAPLTNEVLDRAGLKGCVCSTSPDLCTEFLRGAAAILLTEEALEDSGIDELMECLRSQPAWSDIPILLFADAERSEVYLRTLRLLEGLRNVVLLERPIRLGAALSLIRSAIRGRQRQYELRDLLNALAEAREEAEAANRLKDEFLATLSHELRTPLNAILGWTSMLRDGNVQSRHVIRALDTIHRNATAQVQIVNDLLDISRIVRGNVQLAPKVMELGPLLTLSVESMMPTAEAKSVTLTVKCDAQPVFVFADHDRLQQVLWNLLSNAVKFTPSGGKVHVDMRRDKSDARIRVTDTGAGISPSFLPHVFERFRQGDGSSTREHGGLGLGLSIVRHLIELHGGRMVAHSDGLGKGSTFTVYLPARDAVALTSPATPVEKRPTPRTPDLKDKHILVVDDDRDGRDLLRAMLASTGARISEAASANEALRIIGESRTDIMLADIAMPGKDGYSLIRTVRASKDGMGQLLHAIAVSAYARHEDKQRARGAGFNDHVSKPIQADELYAALERAGRATLPVISGTDLEPGANIH